jgi:hypothetical protein
VKKIINCKIIEEAKVAFFALFLLLSSPLSVVCYGAVVAVVESVFYKCEKIGEESENLKFFFFCSLCLSLSLSRSRARSQKSD